MEETNDKNMRKSEGWLFNKDQLRSDLRLQWGFRARNSNHDNGRKWLKAARAGERGAQQRPNNPHCWVVAHNDRVKAWLKRILKQLSAVRLELGAFRLRSSAFGELWGAVWHRLSGYWCKSSLEVHVCRKSWLNSVWIISLKSFDSSLDGR